jgi:hypothetical protein
MIKDYFNIYRGNYERLQDGQVEDFKKWFDSLTEEEEYNFNLWLKQENLKLNLLQGGIKK